jgi:hypothetical protein
MRLKAAEELGQLHGPHDLLADGRAIVEHNPERHAAQVLKDRLQAGAEPCGGLPAEPWQDPGMALGDAHGQRFERLRDALQGGFGGAEVDP